VHIDPRFPQVNEKDSSIQRVVFEVFDKKRPIDGRVLSKWCCHCSHDGRSVSRTVLEDHAFAPPPPSALLAFVVCEGRTGRVLKHFSDAFAGLGAAFDVLDSADTLPDLLTLE